MYGIYQSFYLKQPVIQTINYFSEGKTVRYSLADTIGHFYFVNARVFFFLHPSFSSHWLCARSPSSLHHHIKRAPERHTQSGDAFAPLRVFWTIANTKVWLLMHCCPSSSSKVFWCYQKKSLEECVSAQGKRTRRMSITCYTEWDMIDLNFSL